MPSELTKLSQLKLNHYFALSGYKSIMNDSNIAVISEIINTPKLLKKIKFPSKTNKENKSVFYSFLNNGIQAINFFMKKVNSDFKPLVKYEKIKIVDLQRIIHSACVEKEINIVKFLLENTEVSVDFQDNSLLRSASLSGDKELIEYLLTSPNLKKHADMKADNNAFIQNLCQYGHLDSLKFILSNTKLKNSMDIHSINDFAFRNACMNKHWDIVESLIFELNIDVTPKIKEFIQDYPNVKKMFDIRSLKSKLLTNLNGKEEVSTQKVKI